MKPIHENLMRLMSPQDRKANGLVTKAEAEEKFEERSEAEMHNTFIQWLNLRDIKFIRASMKKKAKTLKPGWPDFTLFLPLKSPGEIPVGRAAFIEFKMPQGKFRDGQEQAIKSLRKDGFECFVAHSSADAILFCSVLLRP